MSSDKQGVYLPNFNFQSMGDAGKSHEEALLGGVGILGRPLTEIAKVGLEDILLTHGHYVDTNGCYFILFSCGRLPTIYFKLTYTQVVFGKQHTKPPVSSKVYKVLADITQLVPLSRGLRYSFGFREN